MPPKKRGIIRRTATAPFRAVAAVTYPVRHPIKSTKAVGRGAYWSGKQALRPVRATGRGIARAGRVAAYPVKIASYPIRHPVRSAKAVGRGYMKTRFVVQTVWNSAEGRFVRKIVPYAAAGAVGAYVFPGAPLLGAGIGASAARAVAKPDSISGRVYRTGGRATAKTASAVGRGALAVTKGTGRVAGKVIAEGWDIAREKIKEGKKKPEKKSKFGLDFEDYILSFDPADRPAATQLWIDYDGNPPGAAPPAGTPAPTPTPAPAPSGGTSWWQRFKGRFRRGGTP